MSSDISKKNISIYIDQTAANLALTELNAKAKSLTDTITKGTESGKKMVTEIKRLESTKAEIANVQKQIDAGLRPSLVQTTNQVTKLRNELKRMSEDSPGYAAKFESYKKVTGEFNRMNEAIKGVGRTEKSWAAEAKGAAVGVIIGTLVEGALEGVAGYVTGILEGNAKISDSISQLKIYMHGTTKEAQELYSNLRKIDTRTSNGELLDIATIVAKKGVAKDQIVGVTQALDQLFVVLGKEVGEPHEAVASLVKLVNVYSDDHHVTASNIGNIGAAFTKLTSSGVATGAFLISFAERMAGVRGITGITIQSVLGMGAALEELGQRNESAATAAQKLVLQMFLKPAIYAKSAGMAIQDFSALLAKSPVEALIKVAGVLKSTKKAPAELIAAFQEMEISGSKVYGVLGDIAGNADYMRKRLDDSTAAFGDLSSTQAAFAEKNNNLAAELDKLGKRLGSIFQSRSLSDFFMNVVRGFVSFIEVIKAIPKFLKENQTAIYLLLAGIILLNAAYIKASIAIMADTVNEVANVAVKRLAVTWNNFAAASTMAYGIMIQLVTGEITLATAATEMWALATSIGLGPIGILLILIGAAMVAFYGYSNAVKTLTAEQRVTIEVQKKVGDATADAMEKERMLLEVITGTNVELENKQKALQALIDMSPTYLGCLTIENIKMKEGQKMLDNYINSLKAKATIQAKQEVLSDKIKIRETAFSALRTGDPKNAFQTDKQLETYATSTATATEGTLNTAINGNPKSQGVDLIELSRTIAEIKVLQADMDTVAKKNIESIVGKVATEAKAGARTIAELKKEIEALDTSFEQIETNNKSGAAKNRNQRKVLEKELAALEGKTDKEDKSRDTMLQKLIDFKNRLDRIGQDANMKELDEIKETYHKLMTEAVHHGVSLIGLKESENKAIAFLMEKDRKEEAARNEKEFKEQATKEYANQLRVTAEYFEEKKQEESQNYIDGLIDKQQYEANLAAIDVAAKKQDLATAFDYAKVVDQAEIDSVVFKKNLVKDQIAQDLKDKEILLNNAKLYYELLNRAKIIGLENKVSTSKEGPAKYIAEKRLRDEHQKQELEAVDKDEKENLVKGVKSAEAYNTIREGINLKYKAEGNSADAEYWRKKIENVIGYVSKSLSIISKVNSAISTSENMAFNREVMMNNRRRQQIEQLGKNKVLTEVETQRQLNALAVEEDKKRKDLEIKQFKRNQMISIAQALMNGAEAITKDLAGNKFMIPFDIITTAAEVGVIASSEPKFATGGKLSGPSHSDGGIPVVDPTSGRKIAELEGDEYILSKATVANNRSLADLLLNSSMNKGGAKVSMPEWKSRTYKPLDFNGVTQSIQSRTFAKGGVFSYDNRPGKDLNTSSQNISSSNDEHTHLMKLVLHRLENPVSPNLIFSTSKLDDAVAGKARIISNASV